MKARDNVWGQWGEADELGALNYLTPGRVRQALKVPQKGKVYSLGVPWREAASQDFRGKPMHFMRVDGGDFAAGGKPIRGTQMADDFIFLNAHVVSHVDALSHIWYDDKLYNGFSGNSVRSGGARYCGIDKMKGLVSRGLLLDIAKYNGVSCLPVGHAISVADITGCAKAEGVAIRTGDAILLRTGWIKMLKEDPAAYATTCPGLGVKAAKWLRQKQVCAVGADNFCLEVMPQESEAVFLPVHRELIRQGGVYLLEHLDFEELAKDMVYQFLFMVAPLGIPGGSGSPVNPLAIG